MFALCRIPTPARNKHIELQDTNGHVIELRACGDIALDDNFVPMNHLAIFYCKGLAGNSGYPGTLWLYDDAVVINLGKLQNIPPMRAELKLPSLSAQTAPW